MIASAIPRETLLHVAKSLPAAPLILAELGHMILDPNADLLAVADLLKRDTSLTARIIRISNSAILNPGRQLHGSIEEALARIGFSEVYRLAGLTAAAQISDCDLPLYGITGAKLRENSVFTALIMEAAATCTGNDPRSAYTAGLLRSIGKIALSRVAASAPYAAARPAALDGEVIGLETGVVGLSNCEAAAVILHEWRFPPAIVDAIREHCAPSRCAPPLASLLNLAAGAAERCGHGLPGESCYWCIEPGFFDGAGITPEQLDEVMRRALESFGPVRASLA
jgi:HD-like signal output (HDOD) protein